MTKEIETLASIIYETSSEEELNDFLINNGYYCMEEALVVDSRFKEICEQFYITNLI